MLKYSFINELIWIVAALLVGLAICFPILYQAEYRYIGNNLLIALVSVTYIRYIITFKSLTFLKSKWTRFVWFAFNLILFIFVLNRLEYIVRWYDSFAFEMMFQNADLTVTQQKSLATYIFREYTILSIATFVSIIGYNIKILASFWSKARLKSVKKL